MKFLKNLAIITCLISPGAVIAQGYDVEGTDYYKAKASTQIWLEDASNLYIEMAKAFSCIIADSRTDATPNGIWTTLIDETKCGLGDSETKSVVLGSGVNQSSRASNETPQEGSIWFTSADGNKFVVSVAIHESAEDFAPYGRWNFAYYMYSSPDIIGETFTAEDSPATGFVVVSKDTDTNNPGGVVIESFDIFEGEEVDSVRGKFVFSADLTTAKFIGRDQSVRGDGDSYDKGQAGRTNENYYFQISADYVDGELDASTAKEACYARNSSWKTGYQAALYDYTTGEEIPFTGSFSFTTTVEGSSSRGYFSQWGVWLADEDMRPNPSSPTLEIVDNASNALDLIWTSGELLDDTGTSVLTTSTHMSADGGTNFVCTSSDSNECLLGTGDVTDAPFSYNATKNDLIEDSNNDTELYILSNSSHAEPLTLFHDANRNGLIDSDENPIRYDFSVDWDNDANAEKWYSYSSNANDTRSYAVNLDKTMSLKDSDDNDFEWKLNYYKWDHNYVAIKEDGNVYDISPPLYLEKDYDFETDDVNGGRPVLTDEEGPYWILAFDSPRSNPGRPGVDEIGLCLESEDYGYICEINLEELKYNSSGVSDNSNTVFEFNGQSLHSQYYGGVETGRGYMNVLTPKNGTILTDVNDESKKYVVLNREMGDFLDRLDEGDEEACDDISFESLADLGLGLSDIPEEGDYALPQFSWSDQPTVTSDTCEVVIGKLGEGC